MDISLARHRNQFTLTGEGDEYFSIRWKRTSGESGVTTLEEFNGSTIGRPMSHTEARQCAHRYFGSDAVAFNSPDGSFCKWTRLSHPYHEE
jgi:hypothetical protein